MDTNLLMENEFLEKYKLFSIIPSNESDDLDRVYHGYLNHKVCFEAYNHETVDIDAELKIEIPKSYPFALPRVYLLKNGFPINLGIDQHVSEETGLMCLAIPWKERELLMKDPSLINLMETLIIPHIAGTTYSKQRGGYYPQGEYSHGILGYIEGMEEYFSIPLKGDYQKLLNIFIFLCMPEKIENNMMCPFGCGVKYKNCHCKGNLKDLKVFFPAYEVKEHCFYMIKESYYFNRSLCQAHIKIKLFELNYFKNDVYFYRNRKLLFRNNKKHRTC